MLNRIYSVTGKLADNRFAFAVCLLLGFFFGMHHSLMKLIGYDFANIPGDMGDPRFINTILEHGWQWVCGNTDGFWEGHFMFPEKESITYSDNLAANIPIYGIFRLFGLGMHESFLGWLLLTVFLNYICSYYAFSHFTKNKWLAIIGAFVFTFSLATIGQYVHIQMTARYTLPLFFLFTYRFFSEQKNKFLVFAAIAFVWQFYLSMYLGLLLTFCGGLFVVSCFIFHYRKIRFDRNFFLTAGSSLLLIVLAMLPLLLPYHERSKITPFTEYKEVLPTIPTVLSYLRPFPGSKLWPSYVMDQEGNQFGWLHHLFPGGLIVYAVLILPLTITRTKNRELIFFVIYTVIIFFCFLRINDFSFFETIREIPGMGAIRIVTRIINILLFLFTLIFLFTIKGWFTKFSPSKQFLLFLLIYFLCINDQHNNWKRYNRFSRAEGYARINGIADEVKAKFIPGKHKAFAILTDTSDFNKFQIDAMLAAYKLNIKTVNAYTSFCRPEYGDYWFNHNQASLNRWLEFNKIDTSSILKIYR